MRMVALVGPSGTGKSHRASMVADRYKAEAIIDDGLLIVDGRIVAGQSAKRESTRMAAVKRAIFYDADHAQEVRRAIDAMGLRTLLVLGTSRNMVEHIIAALGFTTIPVQWVDVGEIATATEIEIARRVRRQEGKHVIPAPTLEVRKTFSGYLVAPLSYMFHGRGRAMVVEKSIVRPTYSSFGRFYIADTVVSAIAAHVGSRVAGIARVLRVMVQSGPSGVEIGLDVTLETAVNLPRVLERVQSEVHVQIARSTALNILSINVRARKLER